LVYIVGNRLVAQAFDATAMQTMGDPLLLADSPPESGVARRRGAFSASNEGMLVYRLLRRIPGQLTWVDRAGRPVGKVGGPGIYINLNLDSTGRRLAVSMPTGSPPNVDIWLVDFERDDQFTQLTDHAAAEYDPAWSPDGRAVIFNSNRQGPFALFQKPTDPGSIEEAIVSTGWITTPEWSEPAKAIFYTLVSAASRDIWLLPLEHERKPRAFLATKFDERDPAPSPDGRFIAYESAASGSREIYVRPYPAGEPAVPVSVAGGLAPRWRGDGKEIVFMSLDGMMMGAAADTSAGLRIAPPKPLFPLAVSTNGHSYAVANDGQRFLIQVRQPGAEPSPLTVTTNFLATAVR
jgi:dipeptidyl aminopeptidase/acylaminoacyl peptidase